MKVCVTGSKGLIGSSVATLLIQSGIEVWGIDNDSRKRIFGISGSTNNFDFPFQHNSLYHHQDFDLRNIEFLKKIVTGTSFDAVIHCAAQPSHPRSVKIPAEDFEINTVATFNLLEMLRLHNPKTIFIYTSSNKVYGDNPNEIPFVEKDKRYDFKDSTYLGINEFMPIDLTTHTPFGVSKTAADLYVQEYGRTYKMNTTVLRLGCVTGKHHAAVKEHGFLSYLIKSINTDRSYEIIGYKGKQVRDQISSDDVARAMLEIIQKPGMGTVYNLGGGKNNSLSILESIDLITKITGIQPKLTIKNTKRIGDHRCYYTDNSKFESNYPNWKIRDTVTNIIRDIIQYETS